MLQKLRGKKEGFTLIELMIVIAIIGILAAIAIPNFIAYRNKAYCGHIEDGASAVKAAIGDYFSDPRNETLPVIADLTGLSGDITAAVATVTGVPNTTMTISVTNFNACPTERGTIYTITIPGVTSDGWN